MGKTLYSGNIVVVVNPATDSTNNNKRSLPMSNKGQTLQDPFLNALRKEHIPVSTVVPARAVSLPVEGTPVAAIDEE